MCMKKLCHFYVKYKYLWTHSNATDDYSKSYCLFSCKHQSLIQTYLFIALTLEKIQLIKKLSNTEVLPIKPPLGPIQT